MTHRVRVLRRAELDLLAIQAYLRKEATEEIASRVLDALLGAMERLRRFPTMGARPRDTRLRSLGFRYLVRESYLVFYKALASEVRVYRILHPRRAYEELL
jgi:plasmid stabilization system protein ParE